MLSLGNFTLRRMLLFGAVGFIPRPRRAGRNLPIGDGAGRHRWGRRAHRSIPRDANYADSTKRTLWGLSSMNCRARRHKAWPVHCQTLPSLNAIAAADVSALLPVSRRAFGAFPRSGSTWRSTGSVNRCRRRLFSPPSLLPSPPQTVTNLIAIGKYRGSLC